MMPFENLNYEEFETAVGLILERVGFQLVKTPHDRGRPAGPDFEAIAQDGIYYVVEVKHIRSVLPLAALRQFAGDVVRYREGRPGSQGILVVSGTLTPRAHDELAHSTGVHVWDGARVEAMLDAYPDIRALVTEASSSRAHFASKAAALRRPVVTKGTQLLKRLRDITPGHAGWREFEASCTDMLSYVFGGPLGIPDIQSRSDDGLDIIDAIFPIRSHEPPWALVRSEYRTRFVVAEFKNYNDPITQRQVESIAQYLWRPAQRYFGLLVSRSRPSNSAIAARRRAWLDDQKCIIFLDDSDLIEMVQSYEADGEPFDVLDAQMEEFLRTLTP